MSNSTDRLGACRAQLEQSLRQIDRQLKWTGLEEDDTHARALIEALGEMLALMEYLDRLDRLDQLHGNFRAH